MASLSIQPALWRPLTETKWSFSRMAFVSRRIASVRAAAESMRAAFRRIVARSNVNIGPIS
jgi:hypothetical protein